MNPNQISEAINSGIYSKNVTYAMPFSKAAYLEFVRQWKEVYHHLSQAQRAFRLLILDAQRTMIAKKLSKYTQEQLAKLKQLAAYSVPTSIGFVQLNITWSSYYWTVRRTVRMMLVLRKQLKIEAGKLREAALASYKMGFTG